MVRVAGPGAIDAVASLWRGTDLRKAASHTAHLGTITDPGSGEPVDQAVATVYRAPRSYTGDDTVELSLHGSVWVQREVIRLLCAIPGVRTADPGEFTRRAYASGRIDLAQAEAVADIIGSRSRAEARLAMSQLRGSFSKGIGRLRTSLLELASLLELELDFSEEDVEFASRTRLRQLAEQVSGNLESLHASYASGHAIKEGIPVAIIGATNAGKSSLLNALVGDERAIVSPIHGTTRDIVEDTITLGDYILRLMDTAGLRDTTDPIEAIGIARSRAAADRAALILHVTDATESPTHPHKAEAAKCDSEPTRKSEAEAEAEPTRKCDGEAQPNATPIIQVINKIDLLPHPNETPNKSDGVAEPHPPQSDGEAEPHPRDSDGEAEPHPRKCDGKAEPTRRCLTSAKTGQGIETLRQTILETIERRIAIGTNPDMIVTNERQANALHQAAQSAQRIVEALDNGLPGDLIAQDLRETLHHLGEITGEITTPEILTTIFSRFCIGK